MGVIGVLALHQIISHRPHREYFKGYITVSATSNHFHTSHHDSILNVYRKRIQVIST